MNDTDVRSQTATFAVSFVVGVLAIGVAAGLVERGGAALFGVGSLLALGALAAGTFLGFLFGVPQTKSREGEAILANTNIEAISDWLTKVLVGATLVELQSLTEFFIALSSSVAEQVGESIPSAVPGAIIIYFSVLGFLIGWVVTRLRLAPALASVERRLRQLEQREQAALQRGDFAELGRVQKERDRLGIAMGALSTRYEQIRRLQPPGDERTEELEKLVAEMRSKASDPRWQQQGAVEALYNESEAGRVQAFALMQADPKLASGKLIAQSILASKTAFEQYHAVRAADETVAELNPEEKKAIKAAIKKQRGVGGYLVAGTDRAELADNVMAKL